MLSGAINLLQENSDGKLILALSSSQLGAVWYQVATGHDYASDIGRQLGKAPSTINRQLQILRAAGIIKQVKGRALVVRFEPNWPLVTGELALLSFPSDEVRGIVSAVEPSIKKSDKVSRAVVDIIVNLVAELGAHFEVSREVLASDIPRRFVKKAYARHASGALALSPGFETEPVASSLEILFREFIKELVAIPPERLERFPEMAALRVAVLEKKKTDSVLLEEILAEDTTSESVQKRAASRKVGA